MILSNTFADLLGKKKQRLALKEFAQLLFLISCCQVALISNRETV